MSRPVITGILEPGEERRYLLNPPVTAQHRFSVATPHAEDVAVIAPALDRIIVRNLSQTARRTFVVSIIPPEVAREMQEVARLGHNAAGLARDLAAFLRRFK